jgi:hypothetical protein
METDRRIAPGIAREATDRAICPAIRPTTWQAACPATRCTVRQGPWPTMDDATMYAACGISRQIALKIVSGTTDEGLSGTTSETTSLSTTYCILYATR